MHFEGGAGPAFPIEEQRLPGVHNYFLGNDPERWRSNVPLHGAVLLMTGLYPGIDLRARSQDGHFEYDLLVEPGADLEQVVVTVEGADGLRLDPDGTLIIDTVLGPVRQPLPKTWQVTAAGERQEVACRYVLRGENTFGFETSDWDPDLALVVDPGLVYSTYLGGSGDDAAVAIALDATGAATVGGETDSSNFPTTPGAFDTTFNGGASSNPGDAFVTRLDLGTTIGLSQPGGPGTPITIDNGYLIPGNEYYNIFSLDLCPAGPGTGPYLGLCATTLANVQFIVLQASLPVGSPPFHFVATASSVSWGPYTVGPGTLDAVCLDVTGGVLGSYSPVTRITIQ